MEHLETHRPHRVAAAVSLGSLAVLTGASAFADGAPHAAVAAPVVSVAPAIVTVPAVTTAPAATTPAITTPATTTEPATTTTMFVCTNTYKVHGGDSWSLIAAEASVPVAQLYSLNGAGAATALFPGDALCLPAGASVVATVTTVATVAPVVTAAKPATPAVTHHHTPAPVTTAYTSKPSS